jgi:hypothetical protein
MKRILLTLLLSVLTAAAGTAEANVDTTQSNGFVAIAPQPTGHAWWLRAHFRPFETQVRGIPIAKISASWCKATEFRKDLFPPDAAVDINSSYGSFSIDGHFDGTTLRQTALIGVYETCSGRRGSFLLVLAHPQGKPPEIRFLHAFPGTQFGVLAVLPDATIQVFHCMECDNVTQFRWDKSTKRFVRLKTSG